MPAALELAKWGLKLLPLHTTVESVCDCRRDCPSPGKHPRINSWQVQATDDLMTVHEWWSMWPVANIGAVAGASGVVVLDVDPRHGGPEALAALVAEHGVLPPGPRAVTGSGGWHFYFQHPGKPLGNSASKVGLGLDVKADGGYVVVPPSVHATGVSYRWDTDPADGLELRPENIAYPPLPLWLLLLMEKAAAKPAGGAVPVGEVIPQGERRDRLLSLGGTVRHRGASESEIFAYLMAVNAERCAPPMDRGEVAKLAAQVAQFEVGEAILVVGPKTRGEREPARLPMPFNAVELMAMDLPEVKWAVAGLLPEGLAVLAGKPKLGKSWLSFNLGIAIAEGGIALAEIPVDDGDVLILPMEDNKRRLKKRMAIMLGDGAPPPRLWMEPEWPREDEGGLEAIDSWLGSHPDARLVVIDTLAKFRPKAVAGKNSNGPGYGDDYAAMENLQAMAGRHGVCILLITHYRKAFSDDWVDSITGTLGIAGGADTLLGLERKRGEQDATLHVTGRDVDENDWAVQLDPQMGRWVIIGDALDAKMGKETAALIEALTTIGKLAGVEDVAYMLQKTKPATTSLLYRAAANGFIQSYGGRIYGLLRTDPVTEEPHNKPIAKTLFDGIHAPHESDESMNPEAETGVHKCIDSSECIDSSGASKTELASKQEENSTGELKTDAQKRDGSVTSQLHPGASENESRATEKPKTEPVEPTLPPALAVKLCPNCKQIAWRETISGWLCGNCRPAVVDIKTGKAVSQ